MKDEDVTPVTRNDKHAELKVILDLFGWVAFIYMVTHPETFDNLSDLARSCWKAAAHKVSVWAARQDIRSLPETEE